MSGWKLDGQVSTPDTHKTFLLTCLQNISEVQLSLYLWDSGDSIFRVRDRGENWWSFFSTTEVEGDNALLYSGHMINTCCVFWGKINCFCMYITA